MPTKKEAVKKIAAAENECIEVQKHWTNAAQALGGTVITNGYGIYNDQFELRSKLLAAQNHINAALVTLAKIEWPTNNDYDLV